MAHLPNPNSEAEWPMCQMYNVGHVVSTLLVPTIEHLQVMFRSAVIVVVMRLVLVIIYGTYPYV